jgi:hypothetical protein
LNGIKNAGTVKAHVARVVQEMDRKEKHDASWPMFGFP